MVAPTQVPTQGPGFEVSGSRHFVEWLHSAGIKLVATTYHSNRLFLLGVETNGKLSVYQRVFEPAMGLAVSPERLYLEQWSPSSSSSLRRSSAASQPPH